MVSYDEAETCELVCSSHTRQNNTEIPFNYTESTEVDTSRKVEKIKD